MDFVCFDERLVVELDGGQHLDRSRLDRRKTTDLERMGFQVVRFWNDEVLKEMESVRNVILKTLETPSPPPSPTEGEREGAVSHPPRIDENLPRNERPIPGPLAPRRSRVGEG